MDVYGAEIMSSCYKELRASYQYIYIYTYTLYSCRCLSKVILNTAFRRHEVAWKRIRATTTIIVQCYVYMAAARQLNCFFFI